MKRWWMIPAALVAARGVQLMTLQLQYFKLSEFGFSLPFLAVGLLEKLDEFRGMLGVPVVLSSPYNGGLIRAGMGGSQHYIGRAADIKWPVGVSKHDAFQAAIQTGFTGIGVYPWGMHVDIRSDRKPGDPATWGRVYKQDGTYHDVAALTVLRSLES